MFYNNAIVQSQLKSLIRIICTYASATSARSSERSSSPSRITSLRATCSQTNTRRDTILQLQSNSNIKDLLSQVKKKIKQYKWPPTAIQNSAAN